MTKENKGKENIEKVLEGIDIQDKTEMGEVADHVFKHGAGKTNITQDEMVLLFINDAMFKGLGMEKLSPVKDFMELKKSVNGWNMEKFVEGMGGVSNQRSGGSIGGWVKDKLFTGKQQ